MKQSLIALALAFGMMPMAALAQDTNSAPALTDQQRQAIHQTFERFAQQEMQLHQQMRSQVISSLSAVHLRAIGATIGELAIEANPNPEAAAQRIDTILSGYERQRIMAAHDAFRTQSMALHQQMRAALQQIMPPGRQPSDEHKDETQHPPADAGTILLKTLSMHPMMEMMEHMHAEGAPQH